MLDRREQYYVCDISELRSHDFLSLDYVRGYARNRSLIANSTGEHNIDVMTNAGVENASGQDLLMHGRGDPARFPNHVNGTQMVLVSTSCDGELWIRAQRGPEQGALHIVGSK